MILHSDQAVPKQIFLDAKGYIERKQMPFFDFFRNVAFGFVLTSSRGGHFVHLQVTASNCLHGFCNCKESRDQTLCGHSFALYLVLVNWPFEKKNQSVTFDKDPLTNFIKTVGRPIYSQPISTATNPKISMPKGLINSRMANYFGAGSMSTNTTLCKRDRQCLYKAKRLTRSGQEQLMLKKGLPSGRVLFEESRLFSVSKLLFLMGQIWTTPVQVVLEKDHQVRLIVSCEGATLFSWLMPVESWLKGASADWDYWEDRTDFQVRRQALPISYRITTTDSGDLEIESMVGLANGEYQPISQLSLPNSSNLYYHPVMGYFRTQMGLSPFEMEYTSAQVQQVNRKDVAAFLANHRKTLEHLDRAKIDGALFDEVVVEHFKKFEVNLLDFKEGIFTYQIQAQLAGHSLNARDLRLLLHGEGRYRKSGGKLFDTLGYDGIYLKPLYPTAEAEDVATITVSELFRILGHFQDRMTIKTNDLTDQVYTNLKEHALPHLPSLAHTQLTLRSYQQLGYQWLYFLQTFCLGGLLCDQMGLGKTHQGMAMLAALITEKEDAHILIVAPTSVIYHWLDKLRTFCPKIRVTLHRGSDRNLARSLASHNVVISTYATLRNDANQLQDNVFDLLIFDEIQYLKNKNTKSYRALSKLKSLCKVGLTGTPIENHIKELKALMDLVLPGFMGSDPHFKRYFSGPIAQFNDERLKARLRSMIQPFTLRRNKMEVLTELPEKTVDVRTVVMDDYEWDLYKEVKASGKQKLDLVSDGGGALHLFALINQLKQLCDHPALYFKNEEYTSYPSAKWELFKELLGEAFASHEKVVVFSQYLSMIEIFKKYLQSQEVEFACITGKTRNRVAEQARFQTDPKCRVFLGTLGAAGIGIDLTAASILIHYDRWWNAAREEQGTDRVHRIGQKRAVQIYKFCTQNTVEERIDKIIQRKSKLLDEVVAFDDEGLTKVLGVDELLEILA